MCGTVLAEWRVWVDSQTISDCERASTPRLVEGSRLIVGATLK